PDLRTGEAKPAFGFRQEGGEQSEPKWGLRLRGARRPRPGSIRGRPAPDNALQLLEKRVGARGFGLAGRFLDIELLHHAILDQHGIAFRTQPEAVAGTVEGHIDRL